MGTFLGYVGVFAAGVVLDEIFGARLLAKIELLLKQTEGNVLAAVKTELGRLFGGDQPDR